MVGEYGPNSKDHKLCTSTLHVYGSMIGSYTACTGTCKQGKRARALNPPLLSDSPYHTGQDNTAHA